MEIIFKKVDELVPYENNPRINGGAVDAVAQSIKDFGFKNPIIIDKDSVIIAGHTRLKAAQKLGLETVPCIIADDLTNEQIKAYRLVDNKTAELAEWDDELLKIEMHPLIDIDIDMSRFGFDVKEIMREVEGINLDGELGDAEGAKQILHCPKCGFEFEA